MAAAMKRPDHIGRYKVIRELGKGGMGIVYEARNPDIELRVAIKLLSGTYAHDQQTAARFRTEGIAANLPHHPGIVQVLERGVREEDHAAYIVMEYIDGESLRSRLQKHRSGLPVSMVIRLGKQIADAIASAHAHKIIHRDIKPENVMVARDPAVPGRERAKVLDFGIAVIRKKYGDGSEPETLVDTGPFGGMIGTAYYMAPEQWEGSGRGDLDDTTDVYQLGVVLYELLRGRPPFMSKSLLTIGNMHLKEEPEPLLKYKPHLSPEICELVHRMLSKTKPQRPSMKQVAQVLEQFESTLSVSTQNVSAIRPPVVPNRAVALLLLGIFLAFAALLAYELYPRTREVRWRLRSDPTGATVSGPDGEKLGATPWERTRKRDLGKFTVTLTLPGYRPESVQLDSSESVDRSVNLTQEQSPKERK